MTEARPTFWQWFDGIVEAAPETTIGSIMVAAGYEVTHTGGGCLAWRKEAPNGGYALICDEGNGLGDKLAETYLTGFYDVEGEFKDEDQGCVETLRDALIWCDQRIVANGGEPINFPFAFDED